MWLQMLQKMEPWLGRIFSLDEIAVLTALVGAGVEGAIVGKALYAGKFTLEQALKVSGK